MHEDEKRTPIRTIVGKALMLPTLPRLVLLLSICISICVSESVFAQQHASIFDRLRPPLVAAHRGGEYGIPNTLVQFAEALESDDADIIEMDLRLTADGKVVVFHDDTLDKKSDCVGRVEDKTYVELLECKLTNGERIALFSDVLAVVDGRRLISAELKTDEVAVPASHLVLDAHAADWVYFQIQKSRHRYELVRAMSPQLAMMAKVDSEAGMRWILAANDPYLKIVEVGRDSVNDQLVRDLHAQQKLLSLDTWRYQFTEERFVASCDRAFEQGVDIAVTNNPASCHRQKEWWSRYRLDAGHFYDRQHVRRWARIHPATMQGLTLLGAFLLPVFVIGTLLRKRSPSLRSG
jgi:glycerophosphoryl diester phosphodiesterase